MKTQPVPVLPSVRDAYAFFLANGRPILLAGLPYTAAYLAWLWLAYGTNGAMPAGLGLTLIVAVSLGSIALSASALRLAVRGERSGPLGLQLGRDELRLFTVSLLVFLLAGIVFVLVYMFWGVVALTVASGAVERAGVDAEAAGLDMMQAAAYMSAADWAVTGLAGLLCTVIVIWLLARLTLALPASFAARKVMVMKAWPLSDGNGWRIALSLVLAGLPLIALELALYEGLSALAGSRLLDMAARFGEDAAGLPGALRLREYQTWLGVFSAVNLPVFAGLYASIYRDRTRDPS
jgi:hypothetical protein